MKSATRAWVQKAEADYETALDLDQNQRGRRHHVCFHCQQSAEKYLKALLEELAQPVPRTHDCGGLLTQLLAFHADLRGLRRGAEFLTNFAVTARYPGFNARKRQAVAAIR